MRCAAGLSVIFEVWAAPVIFEVWAAPAAASCSQQLPPDLGRYVRHLKQRGSCQSLSQSFQSLPREQNRNPLPNGLDSYPLTVWEKSLGYVQYLIIVDH